MRKFLLFIIISGVLYMPLAAQEVKIGKGALTFGGKIASGIFYDADDAPMKDKNTGVQINQGFFGEEGRVRMWNETDSKTGLRADLTAAYLMENVGFKIRLRSDTALEGQDRTVIARFAYGWVNLFNEGLKFTGGYIDLDNNVWGTLGDLDKDVSGNGLRVQVQPFRFFDIDENVAGALDFGAFFRISSTAANSNIGRDDEGKEVYRTLTPARGLGETAIGLRYTHPWFYARLQYEMDSDIDGADVFEGNGQTIIQMMKVWSGAADEDRFMFGAGFTMLPELRFHVEGQWEGLGNWEARGVADLRQTLAYSFENLTIPVLDRFTLGIRAQEILWGYNMATHFGAETDFGAVELTPWMQFKPYIEARIAPDFKAGFEFGYGFGHLVKASLFPVNSNLSQNNAKVASIVNEKSNIFIKPQLWYTFGNGLALTAWYKATFITYQDLVLDDPRFADLRHYDNGVIPRQAGGSGMLMVDKLVQSQVALEFIWSF